MIKMPGSSHKGPLPPLTEHEVELRDRLKIHVEALAGKIGERNFWRYEALQESARYIEQTFEAMGYRTGVQEFRFQGKAVRNLEVEVPGHARPDEIIAVGAHYDSVLGCPGANDNATGVAAVLEMARYHFGRKPARTIRFVTFVNEEPPFYLSNNMGSRVYARRARERGEKIVAMLSVETIGYYSDAKGSQRYPIPFSFFYPDTANFIGFVANLSSRNLVRQSIALFRQHTAFPSEGVAAPSWIMGIGWSDHWSFWKEGYPAIMVTDTALFRYGPYHSAQDTPDKIDLDRVARAVAGLSRVVEGLADGLQ